MPTVTTHAQTSTGDIMTLSDGDAVAEIVIHAVCQVYGVTPRALVSVHRYRELADARHTVAHLLSTCCGYSCAQIGRELQRTRTNIYDSIKRAGLLLDSDREFAERYRDCHQIVTRR